MRALLAFFAMVAAGGAAAAQDWKPFTTEGFTVQFPADPDVDVAGIATADIAAVHNYSLAIGEEGYRVTVLRATSDGDRDQMNTFAVGTITNTDCSVASNVEMDTPAGHVREVVSTCRGQTYRARFLMGGDRLYEWLVTGPAGFETAADTVRFLDSFKLVDGPAEWKPLVAEADGFAVDVPGTPAIKERPFDPASFTGIPAFIVYHGDGLLRVTAIHFRPGVLGGATQDQVFDYARGTAPTRCAILFDGPMESPLGAAHRIAGRCPDSVDFRMEFILADDTLYELFASGPEGFIAGPDADRFITSFKVLGH